VIAMKKILSIGVLTILISINLPLYGADKVDNLVNSPQMAMDLTEIYIRSVYGKETAKSQKPYIVKETSSGWQIEGKPPEALGGSFLVIISKKNGEVLKRVCNLNCVILLN